MYKILTTKYLVQDDVCCDSECNRYKKDTKKLLVKLQDFQKYLVNAYEFQRNLT